MSLGGRVHSWQRQDKDDILDASLSCRAKAIYQSTYNTHRTKYQRQLSGQRIITHMISHPFLLIPPCLAPRTWAKEPFLALVLQLRFDRTHAVSQSPLTCPPIFAPRAYAPEPLFAVRNGFRRWLYAMLVVLQLLFVGSLSQ